MRISTGSARGPGARARSLSTPRPRRDSARSLAHPGDREDVGQLRPESADLQGPSRDGPAPSMRFIHGQDDPAPQPFDGLEIEQDPMVPRLDEVDQVAPSSRT